MRGSSASSPRSLTKSGSTTTSASFPWSSERARSYIREQSGQHFVPALVAVVEQLFDAIDALQQEFDDAGAAADLESMGSVES